MKNNKVKIIWPNGKSTFTHSGEDWFKAANEAGYEIPSGCLGGSCGACEIEINGVVTRACIDNVPNKSEIKVELIIDPYW